MARRLDGVIGRLLTPFAVRTMKRQAVADVQTLMRLHESDQA